MKAPTRAGSLRLALSALGIAALLASFPAQQARAEDRQKVAVGGYQLSGPYTHENLTLFLIHGEDTIKGKTFLTLPEALDQKKAVVHETRNVNELAIENVSPDAEIFVQSGDIVKGGQQDRLLAFDLILPPKSGKVSIAAYCVEAGRWTQRGNEAVHSFDGSYSQLPTKELKLAAKAVTAANPATGNQPNQSAAQIQAESPAAVDLHQRVAAGRVVVATRASVRPGGQTEVWKEVAALQKKLERNLKSEVRSAQSNSSLELTLENKKVQEEADRYVQKLSPIIEGKEDVVGYAFAINGKVNSADVYGSHALFLKLWPRLLKASAVEALAELSKDKFEPATAEAVKACLLDAEKGKASSQEVTNRVQLKVQETDKDILFETRDRDQKMGWVHRNYLTK